MKDTAPLSDEQAKTAIWVSQTAAAVTVNMLGMLTDPHNDEEYREILGQLAGMITEVVPLIRETDFQDRALGVAATKYGEPAAA